MGNVSCRSQQWRIFSPMFSSLASCAWRLQAPSPLTWLCRQSQLQAPWQWYCHWLMNRKQLTGRGSERHKQLTATRWHFRAHLLKQLSQHFMSKLRARMEVFQGAPLHWTRAQATMFPPLTWLIWDLALIPLMQSQVWDSHQSASILTYWTNLSEHPQPLLQRQNLCFPRHSQSTMIQPLGRILFSIKSTVCHVLSFKNTDIHWTSLGTGHVKAPQFCLARCSGIGHYPVPVCIWQNNKSTGLVINWSQKMQTIQQVAAAMWLAMPPSIQWIFVQSNWDSRIHCCARILAGEPGMNLRSSSWQTNGLLIIDWLPQWKGSMAHRFVYLQTSNV